MIKLRFVGFAFTLLVLLGASQATAITICSSCACNFACSAVCTLSSGGISTCGAQGICVGSPSCGGGHGCLTAKDADFLRVLLSEQPGQVSPAGYERGRAAARLTWRLTQFVEEKKLGEVFAGETGFLVTRETSTVQVPALAFLSQGRLAKRAPAGSRAAAPDLVAEVLSAPASVTAGRVHNWLTAGTRAVLVLDPQTKTLTVHRSGSAPQILRAEETLEMTDIVPGWTLQVGDLFE